MSTGATSVFCDRKFVISLDAESFSLMLFKLVYHFVPIIESTGNESWFSTKGKSDEVVMHSPTSVGMTGEAKCFITCTTSY